MVDNPLYVHSHSKLVLSSSIGRDTEFLANNLIMDYSLLVGVDESNQLVVGIIGEASDHVYFLFLFLFVFMFMFIIAVVEVAVVVLTLIVIVS